MGVERRQSGFYWLGELPSHWSVKRLRSVAECLDGQRVPLNAVERAERHGDIPYWGANTIVDHVDSALFDEELILLGEDGAPFFDRSRPVAFFSSGPIWPNNHVHVLRPQPRDAGRFITYALNATDYAWFVQGATRDKLTQGAMNNIPLPWPPFQEREAIVAFLDRESAKIDALLDEQARLMSLLAEKRVAAVTCAVTEGVGSTSMAETGVDWMPRAPEHWQVVRNKAVFVEVDDRSTDGEGELLTVSHLTGVTPRAEKDVNMFMAETLEGYKRCRAGDLVINTMWAWMGALGCSPLDGLVSPSYNVYRPRIPGLLDSRYYDSLCRVPAHRTAMKANSTGVWESRLRLYPEAFLSMRVVLPPLDEQRWIVDHFSPVVQEYDRLMSETQRSMDLLKERRAALVTAAVTGQIDVQAADGRQTAAA